MFFIVLQYLRNEWILRFKLIYKTDVNSQESESRGIEFPVPMRQYKDCNFSLAGDSRVANAKWRIQIDLRVEASNGTLESAILKNRLFEGASQKC